MRGTTGFRHATVLLLGAGFACSAPVACPDGATCNDESQARAALACAVASEGDRAVIRCDDGTHVSPPAGITCGTSQEASGVVIRCDDGTRVVVSSGACDGGSCPLQVFVTLGADVDGCVLDDEGAATRALRCGDGTVVVLPPSQDDAGPGCEPRTAGDGGTTLNCGATLSMTYGGGGSGPEEFVACHADTRPTSSCRRNGADGCRMLPAVVPHLDAGGSARTENTETEAQDQQFEHDVRIVFRIDERSRVSLWSRRGLNNGTSTCLSTTCDGPCVAETSSVTPNENLTASIELDAGAYFLRAHWFGTESWEWTVTPLGTDGGSPTPDAGAPEPDAGAPEPDAGAPEPDAGAPEPDGGTPDGGGDTCEPAAEAAVFGARCDGWRQVESWGGRTVAIAADGSLWTWGIPFGGWPADYPGNCLYADGSTNGPCSTTPVRIGDRRWRRISLSIDYDVGIQEDGSLWAWGNNDMGQLGIGSLSGAMTPTQVGCDRDWTDLSAGRKHVLALKADGTLWGWGKAFAVDARHPEATNCPIVSTTEPCLTKPVRIGAESTWSAVSAGDEYSLALKADGSIWEWGTYEPGVTRPPADTCRAWHNTLPCQIAPARVGTAQWRLVRSKNGFSIGVQVDGSLHSWRKQYMGRLGLPTAPEQAFVRDPTPVLPGTTWTDVALGTSHAIGVRADGTLWAWGSNTKGETGPVAGTTHTTPVLLSNETGWVGATAGSYSTHLLRADGSLWALGWSVSGQLGALNPPETLSCPTRIMTSCGPDGLVTPVGPQDCSAVR